MKQIVVQEKIYVPIQHWEIPTIGRLLRIAEFCYFTKGTQRKTSGHNPRNTLGRTQAACDGPVNVALVREHHHRGQVQLVQGEFPCWCRGGGWACQEVCQPGEGGGDGMQPLGHIQALVHRPRSPDLAWVRPQFCSC